MPDPSPISNPVATYFATRSIYVFIYLFFKHVDRRRRSIRDPELNEGVQVFLVKKHTRFPNGKPHLLILLSFFHRASNDEALRAFR